MKPLQSLVIIIIACLTLGLAPFTPEPHLWGKIKWIAGGGTGMQLIDYWDTFMHGAPWIAAICWVIYMVFIRKLVPML